MPKTTIKEVLEETFQNGFEFYPLFTSHGKPVKGAEVQRAEDLDTALTDIAAILEGVIGEKQPPKYVTSREDGTTGTDPITDIENGLKKQQRSRLKEVLGK